MERIETIFREKLTTFENTFDRLDHILNNKDPEGEVGSLYLQITSTLEQLRFHESNLATIASLNEEPISSEFNNRINQITLRHEESVKVANAKLLDLDTKLAGERTIPDSDDDVELGLSTPHSTMFTPFRSRRPLPFTSSLLKTPKLSIPTFNGDHKTFPTFWRQFKALIHDDPTLSLQQKSIFLAEALQGPAKVHLENKSLDGKSYDRIIQTLQTTYQPKLKVDYRIYDELSKLPLARNDPHSVRCRVNEIRALLDQLDNDQLYKSEDPAWVKLITTKFPTEIINMLCWRTSRATSIKQLLINIEQTADSMESFSIYSDKSPFTPNHQHIPSKFLPKPISYPTFTQPPKLERPCVFCDRQGHRSAKCTVVTTPQQRRDIIKQKSRCWICFSPTHTSIKCTFEKCRNCKKDHHSSLCVPTLINKPRTPQNMNCTVLSPKHKQPSPAYLMTSKIALLNPQTGKYEPRTIFLDQGATQSFIYQPTANAHQLHTLANHNITTSGFAGSIEQFATKTVEATIQSPYGKTITLPLLTSPKPLTGNLKCCTLSARDREYLERAKIVVTNQFINGETFSPDILIGIDLYDTLIIEDPYETLPSGLKIKHTQLGPCIYGKSTNTEDAIAVNTIIMNPQVPEEIMIKQLFEIDNLGIASHDGALNKSELFFNDYATRLKFDNGYITAPLPLKSNVTRLQSNKSLALATLNRLQKALKQDPSQQEHYQKMIKQYVQDLVIEEAPRNSQEAMIYYMPHRGVWNPKKTKPLRIVFNASAKQKGQLSLNDVTATGESFTNKIIDILIGIRTTTFFLMCDIEGAFTQIRIAEDCKDLCRFLWLKDINKSTTPDNVVEFRFNRLAFGITSSPSVLNMSLHAFLKTQSSPLIEKTLRYLYVDNIFYTTNQQEDLEGFHSESKRIFSNISMNVREYFSNSTEFNIGLEKSDQHPDKQPKILGVQYNPVNDEFTLTGQMRTQQSYTKRDLLSHLHSIYDPLGLCSPLLLPFKLLLRQVMAGTLNWKDQVPSDIVQSWNNISTSIGSFKVQIPRQMTTSQRNKEIWIFVDASVSAIAACAYCTSENRRSPLIMGKIKLAPRNRTLTIPRLELSAIFMGIKIAETIYNNINQPETVINIASDSQIALSWLYTKRSLPVFVGNLRQNIERIARKLESQQARIHYHYVDTTNNPADLGTRGTTDMELLKEKWLFSPIWLSQQEDRPVTEVTVPYNEEEPDLMVLPVITKPKPRELLFDIGRFSQYNRIKRTAGLVLKAALTFFQRTGKTPTSSLLRAARSNLNNNKQCGAAGELLLIKEAQKDLQQQYTKQFRTITDKDGLLLVQTRLIKATLPQQAKFPYLLPKKAPLGKLILMSMHKENAHIGVNHLLSLFLQRFYMTAARQTSKSVVKSCVPCQRLLSRPFNPKFLAPLPEDRITKAMPFTHTGLDCIGPIRYNKDKQIYIVIFTCLTIRAIHLEPIADMTSTTFLNAFTRFVARRGLPDVVRSDNGSNFVHSAKILAMLETYDKEHRTSFTRFLEDHHITWIFNTPSAPWTGGVWERLVAIVKSALFKSLNLKLVNNDQIQTAIIKIEGIINSRPITYTNSENVEEKPLTPADFLTHGSPVLIPGGSVEELGNTLDQPNAIQTNREAFENLQKVDILTEAFWNKWSKEYLLCLRHAHMSTKNTTSKYPSLNEVVLVEEDNLNRSNWTMARVTEIVPSSDNVVRTAKVKFASGKVLTKPVEKLYPLELKDEITQEKRAAINHVSTWSQKSIRWLFRLMMIIQLITVSIAEPMFTCSTFHVTFSAQPYDSTVCIDTECYELPAAQSEVKQLRISVTPRTTSISRYTKDKDQTQQCQRPHPCDFPPPILLHILGNPHCNPLLAILLVMTPIICLFLLCIIIGRTYNKRRRTGHQRSEPTISYIPSLLFAIIFMMGSCQACATVPNAHRHVELICNDLHNCTRLNNEEIPFNPLQKTLCSNIKFANETIGKLSIEILHNTFTCRKIIRGFTRITNLKVHTVQRCVGTVECPLGIGCDNKFQDSFITSLTHTYEYPGRVYCNRAGGGLFQNNCALPIEGCIIFRPTYVPDSNIVYEEIQCGQWKQEVHVKISIEYHNNTQTYERSLQPYRKYRFHGISVQVSSVTAKATMNMHDTIFLMSNETDYMIPERRKPALICSSAGAASYNFKSCQLRQPCICVGAATQLSCSCDSANTRELENYKLPKITPDFEIAEKYGKITITSSIEETTMMMETPDFSIESLYLNRYPCTSDFQMMTGCYKCKEGAELSITCDTKDELYAVFTCDSFSKAIKCSDKNPITKLKLYFNEPNVNENCTLTCGKAERQIIELSARLHFVLDSKVITDNYMVDHNETAGIAFVMPHFGPIMDIFVAHWKWIVMSLAMLAAASYVIGMGASYIVPFILPAVLSICCFKRSSSIPTPGVSGNT